jgi:hypothetical protein
MNEPRRKAIYTPLPPDRVRDGMKGMSARRFALLTGSDPRRVDRWKAGDEEAPHWVALVLTLFTLPGAIPLAERVYGALGERGRLEKVDSDGGEQQ